ncbi:MAG: 3-methyl-2-oxobutanoate hydroxymethyltransferase [Methylococcales bacterium]|nr:3-methyl-2-oxobutanoate hydroxymethyltransferase [Methylococcales bacterium]
MTYELTLTDLAAMKQRQEKITCLTAYDASFARLIDQAGIDIILVGDSLGPVIQGQSSTVPVTLSDVVYHCQCVRRGCHRAWLIADLPFLSYVTADQAFAAAALLMQQAGARMIKLEGAHDELIAQLVAHGVPVCAHLGLLPQQVHQLGGYRVQGRKADARHRLLNDAKTVQAAGASLLVLECVPSELAAEITTMLDIPVIGIGAGSACDGQVLVLYDILGLSPHPPARFTHNFLAGQTSISGAIEAFRDAVKQHHYPTSEHSYR